MKVIVNRSLVVIGNITTEYGTTKSSYESGDEAKAFDNGDGTYTLLFSNGGKLEDAEIGNEFVLA